MKLIRLLAAMVAGAATLILPRRRPGRLRLDRARTALRLAARGGARYAAGAPRPGGPPRLRVAGTLVIDSRWITRQWIPALDRRIKMTCSLSLEPDM